MTIGKFNFAPRTQTLYPDAGIQKKMRLAQESEIVTTDRKLRREQDSLLQKRFFRGQRRGEGGRVTRCYNPSRSMSLLSH